MVYHENVKVFLFFETFASVFLINREDKFHEIISIILESSYAVARIYTCRTMCRILGAEM